MLNLKFLAQTVPEKRRDPKISKIGHVTPYRPPLTEFFIIIVSAPLVNLHAKFEVSSSNLSRDMEGVPKFQK